MKYLKTPNGKRIVGTSETVMTMRKIIVTGLTPEGKIEFDYDENANAVTYYETEEQRKDRRGHRLFQDTDGIDWPEHKLTVEDEPAEVAS